MPRYSGGGFGGYGQSGGNPFYDPNSPTPDFAGGLRSTIQQMLGMKQMREQQKQEQEQQMWARGQAEQKMAADKAQAEALEKYRQESLKTPDEREADRLFGMGQFKDWQAAYKFVVEKAKVAEEDYAWEPNMATTIKMPKDVWDQLTKGQKKVLYTRHINIAYPDPSDQKGMTAYQSWQQSKDAREEGQEEQEGVISNMTDAIEKIGSKLQVKPAAKKGPFDTAEPVEQVDRSSLEKAYNHLFKVRGMLRSRRQPSNEDMAQAQQYMDSIATLGAPPSMGDMFKNVVSGIGGAVKALGIGGGGERAAPPQPAKTQAIPPGTPTATDPKTGKKVAFLGGKWIPIN